MVIIFLKKWLPAILWAGMIFFISSIPHLKSNLPDIWDLIFRKFAHAGEFAVLAVLIKRGFQESKNEKSDFLKTFLIVFLYAVFDETHQHFVAGRVASALDVIIDSLGALISLIAFYKQKAVSKQ